MSLGLASLGSAVARAIGGKTAAPDHPVVALVGDGASVMNRLDVHAAVHHEIPMLWLVRNHGGHGMVNHREPLLLGKHLETCELATPANIHALSMAIGATSSQVRAREALRAALDDALALNKPSVIDAIIDPDVVPDSAARQARAVKAGFVQESPRGPKVRR